MTDHASSAYSREALKRRLLEVESAFSAREEETKGPPDEGARPFCDPQRIHDLVYGDAVRTLTTVLSPSLEHDSTVIIPNP